MRTAFPRALSRTCRLRRSPSPPVRKWWVTSNAGAGIGLHNVHDQILPSAQWPFATHHCRVIGAPMTFGQPYVGTDVGPQKLCDLGLVKNLEQLQWTVERVPDLQFQRVHGPEYTKGKAKNHLSVGAGTKQVAETVYDAVAAQCFPLILGGDHSIGVGSLAGLLRGRPDTGVLWIDAHADLNTPALSESGNMHGMPIGMLMQNLNQDVIPGFEWLDNYPRLAPEQIVYIGLRDVDSAERQLIHDLKIKTFTMTEIDRFGIGSVMDQALLHLKGRPLHLSYDIDAIDPVLAPATGTAVRGGLTFREAHYVAEAAAQSGHLQSVEMVELNPSLSNETGADSTVELGLHILLSLMGKCII